MLELEEMKEELRKLTSELDHTNRLSLLSMLIMLELEEMKTELDVTQNVKARLESDWINHQNQIRKLKTDIGKYMSQVDELESLKKKLDEMQIQKKDVRVDNMTLK